jgi:SpoIID/LytB domain protein
MPVLPWTAGGAAYAAAESPTSDHIIRVHLSSLGSPTSFEPAMKGSYTIEDNGKKVSGAITIAASGSNAIKLTAGNSSYSLDKDILLKAASHDVGNYARIGTRNYPGDLRVINKSGKLKIISHVDMETYVLGVVPYEAGNGKSNLEALKAQAVAARSFAYYVSNSRDRSEQEHDVVNTTSSQVYNGYSASYENANAAVVATACQILQTAGGGNVYSCYSASNGGHTEYPKSSGAAGTNFSYLPYRKDSYDLKYALAHDGYNASVTIPKSLAVSDLQTSSKQPYKMLRAAMKTAGEDPADLPADGKVTVKKINRTDPRYTDNDKPRVYTGAKFTLAIPKHGDVAAHDAVVTLAPYRDGSGIKRPFLNRELGLSNKSKFSLLYLRDDGDSYLLAAVRYGHSAGMSQIGAYQMAAAGKSYRDILKFYYLEGTETKLVTKDWPIANGVTGKPVAVADDPSASSPGDPGSAAAPAEYKVTKYSAKGSVTAVSLNVRKGPGTTYKALGALKKSAAVTVTGKSGDWYRIKYGKGTGFVIKTYVKITKKATTTSKKSAYPFKAKISIKSGSLNVRSGAGTKYKKLGTLKKNKKVTIKGAKGSWYRITYKSKKAYILKKYVKKI